MTSIGTLGQCGRELQVANTSQQIAGTISGGIDSNAFKLSFGSFPPSAALWKVVRCSNNSPGTGGVFFNGIYELINPSNFIWRNTGYAANSFVIILYQITALSIQDVPNVYPATSSYWSSYTGSPTKSYSGADQSYTIGTVVNVSEGTFIANQNVPATRPGSDGGVYWEVLNNVVEPQGGLCTSTVLFCHSGGNIGMFFPVGCSSAFTFNLIRLPFLISMLEPYACYPAQTSGYGHWKLEFYIKNLTNIAWPVTVTLLNGGGISNAAGSAAVTLAANSTTGVAPGAITFDADPKNNLITATLQISICGIVVGTLTYPMYPIYAASLTSINAAKVNCGGTGPAIMFWKSTLTLTQMNPLVFNNYQNLFSIESEIIISAGGVRVVSTNCSNPASSLTLPVSLPIRSFVLPFLIEAASSPQQVTITAAMFNSGLASYPSWVALPSFSQTITVPAA